MPPKGYHRKVAASPGDAVKRRAVWIRQSDWQYLKDRYGEASEAIRKLVTTDRRAFEDREFGVTKFAILSSRPTK